MNASSRLHSILTGSAFIYLLLPLSFFLLGWFEPYISIPLVLWAVVETFRQFRRSLNGKDETLPALLPTLTFLAFAALFAFGLNYRAGYTGTLEQFVLDFAQRNAVYGNLCLKDWPLVLPDGRGITYYMAAYLPPAFFSKLVNLGDNPVVIMLWNTVGVFIALGLAFFRCGKISSTLIFIIVCFLAFDPVLLFRPLSDITEQFFGFSFNANPSYEGLMGGIAITTNHAPGILLLTLLLFDRRITRNSIPLLAAFTLPISIFGAITLLPFFVLLYLKHSSPKTSFLGKLRESTSNFFRSSAGWLSIAVAFTCYLYYGRSEGELIVTSQFFVTHGLPIPYIIAKNILHIAAFGIFILLPALPATRRHPALFHTTWATLLLISLLYIGNAGPNELCFKGNHVIIIIAALLWQDSYPHAGKLLRMITWGFLLLMVYDGMQTFRRDISNFGYRPENISNPFNSHLYHPGTLLEQSIPSTKPATIPGIMYEKEGDFRKVFPFLPPDEAQLYRRPSLFTPKTDFMRTAPKNENLHVLWHF